MIIYLPYFQLVRQPWQNVKSMLTKKHPLSAKQVEHISFWVLTRGTLANVLERVEELVDTPASLTGSNESVNWSAVAQKALADLKTLAAILEVSAPSNYTFISNTLLSDIWYCRKNHVGSWIITI